MQPPLLVLHYFVFFLGEHYPVYKITTIIENPLSSLQQNLTLFCIYKLCWCIFHPVFPSRDNEPHKRRGLSRAQHTRSLTGHRWSSSLVSRGFPLKKIRERCEEVPLFLSEASTFFVKGTSRFVFNQSKLLHQNPSLLAEIICNV